MLRRQNLIWETEDTILTINNFIISNTTILIEETTLIEVSLVIYRGVVLREHLSVRVKVFTN